MGRSLSNSFLLLSPSSRFKEWDGEGFFLRSVCRCEEPRRPPSSPPFLLVWKWVKRVKEQEEEAVGIREKGGGGTDPQGEKRGVEGASAGGLAFALAGIRDGRISLGLSSFPGLLSVLRLEKETEDFRLRGKLPVKATRERGKKNSRLTQTFFLSVFPIHSSEMLR